MSEIFVVRPNGFAFEEWRTIGSTIFKYSNQVKPEVIMRSSIWWKSCLSRMTERMSQKRRSSQCSGRPAIAGEILESRVVPTELHLAIQTVQAGAAGNWDLVFSGFDASSNVLVQSRNGFLEVAGQRATLSLPGQSQRVGMKAADITYLGIGVLGEVNRVDLRGIKGADFQRLAQPGAFTNQEFDVAVFDNDGANEIFGSDDPAILERLDGGKGNDTIHGGKGTDFLNGGAGNDQLFGDDGNDTLGGDLYADQAGDDSLEGNSGDDWLIVGQEFLGGNDQLDGGAGQDRLVLNGTSLVDGTTSVPLTGSITVNRESQDEVSLGADWQFALSEIRNARLFDTFTAGNQTTSARLLLQSLNTPPTVTTIAKQSLREDAVSNEIKFVVNDTQTNARDLRASVTSSNSALISVDRVEIRGSEQNRSLVIRPNDNQTGSATLTVTVSDGQLITTQSFVVEVTPVNDAPTIAAVTELTLDQDSRSPTIPVRLDDIDSPIEKLSVKITSSNESLIPARQVLLAGSGRDRTLQITPSADKSGSARIVLTVTDGSLTSTATIQVTVRPVLRDIVINLVGQQSLVVKSMKGELSVTVDGVPNQAFSGWRSSWVRSLTINGGDGNNRVDLSAVKAAEFPNLRRDTVAGTGIVVNGQDGNDTILGSTLADDLFGGLGNDSITAGTGDDWLVGDAGDDVLDGGAGNDELREAADVNFLLTVAKLTGVGADKLVGIEAAQLRGGDSANRLDAIGFTGKVTLVGGAGDDSLLGGTNNDVLLGQSGNDSLLGGKGNDSLNGGDGQDTLNGGLGDDKLEGEVGDDALSGFDGKDTLEGGDGQDTIIGGKGNDSLFGGAGNDWLRGDAGTDVTDGQSGDDVALSAGADPTDVVVPTTELVQAFVFAADWIDRV